MKHEMETNTGSHPQSPVDDESNDTATRERRERQGRDPGRQASCEDESEDRNPSNSSNPLELDKLEERFRKECRKSCRRNFWIELLKTAGKIAGVILAAFGLSSFNEEN